MPAPSGGPELAAAGWVRVHEGQAWLGGQVHPAYRRQGRGTQLVRWAEMQAQALGATSLLIRNEAFTPGSAALYAHEGYTCDFVEHWLERDLTTPLPAVACPFPTVPWTAETAPLFYAVYEAAFAERRRPGTMPPAAPEWISDYNDDSEFRPDLSLLALAGEQPVGFVTTAITPLAGRGGPVGWIAQVGVHPAWRGQAIAAGLIVAVLAALQGEGYPAAGLHVNANNPHAAGLYARLGFGRMGQRAKYSKEAAP